MQCTNPEELFTFPCDHVFKAIGAVGEEFVAQVAEAVGRVLPVSGDALKVRLSDKGAFQSVSVVVRLHNYQQLVDIYSELKKIPSLKYLL